MNLDAQGLRTSGTAVTDKPKIDTIWFDLSVRLILFEHISGITRTIERLYQYIKPCKEYDVRYCVVLPSVGFGEVDMDWLAEAIDRQSHRRQVMPPVPIEPTPLPVKKSVSDASATKPKSKYRILPYKLRHGLRTASKGIGNWWAEPPEAELPPASPPPPPPYPYHPYPYQSVKGPMQLGPRDLFLSFGGQWIMAGTDTTLVKKKGTHGFHHASLIYDMIPTNAPHLSPHALSESTFTNVTHRQLLSSDLILTISEYSKKEIIEYGTRELIPTPPVEVFYLGSDLPDQREVPSPIATDKATGHKPFILTVGSVESRKNQFFLYYVWRQLVTKLGPDKTPKLVVAGKPGWMSDIFFNNCSRDPLVKHHIVLRTDPTDHELHWLYRNCLFTVYPSMYEGWGLPVEESFVYGKLCVTTTASSLPEVGGEFADFVPPDELESLTAAIIKALDPTYRAGREQLIRDKFKPHTWDQAAVQVMKLLNQYFDLQPPARAS